MIMPPRAEVVISVVSHGHGDLLAALLDDLVQWRRDTDLLIVTLNVPETSSFCRARWSGIEWRDNPSPKGFGANHNSALHGRPVDWCAIINPDIRLASNAIREIVDRAHANPNCVLLGPAVVDGRNRIQDSARKLLTPGTMIARIVRKIAGPSSALDQLPPENADWLAGMFLVVRGDVFRWLGGFDERFFLYCEDIDLSLRVQNAGFDLAYVQDVMVVHDAQRDSHRSLRHLRWHIRSVLRLWFSSAFWTYLTRRRGPVRAGVRLTAGRATAGPVQTC